MTQVTASESSDIQIQEAIEQFPFCAAETQPFRVYDQYISSLFFQPPVKNTKTNAKSVVIKAKESEPTPGISMTLCDMDAGDLPLQAPFGLQNPLEGSANMDRKTLNLTIANDNLLSFCEKFDERILNEAQAKKNLWLGRDNRNKEFTHEAVELMYSPLIKYAKIDPEKPAPAVPFKPTIAIKVITGEKRPTNIYIKHGEIQATDVNGRPVYHANGTPVLVPKLRRGTADDLSKENIKGCGIIPIVQVYALWFAGGKYGCSLQATDILIIPAPPRTQPSFIFGGYKAQIVNPGDEVATPHEQPAPNQIIDENSMVDDDEDDQLVVSFAGTP